MWVANIRAKRRRYLQGASSGDHASDRPGVSSLASSALPPHTHTDTHTPLWYGNVFASDMLRSFGSWTSTPFPGGNPHPDKGFLSGDRMVDAGTAHCAVTERRLCIPLCHMLCHMCVCTTCVAPFAGVRVGSAFWHARRSHVLAQHVQFP